MKKAFFLFAISMLFFSCSKDSESKEKDQQSLIIGTWNLTEVTYDEVTASSELKFASAVADKLIAENCDLMSFVFNEDKTVIAESSINFIEIDLASSGNQLVIECPTTSEMETSTWSLESDQLTFIDVDGLEETITIQLNGDTLIIPGDKIDPDNFETADIVLVRQ